MIETLAAWSFFFVTSAYPPYLTAEYSPSVYPTEAVCEAARKGAIEFGIGGVPEKCTNDPFIVEAQWLDRVFYSTIYGDRGEGGPY